MNIENESSTNSEDFLKSLDIELAELEKLGSLLLIIGYALFFYGANLNIEETLNINTTGSTPTSVTLTGAKLVLCGYIILWIVASREVDAVNLENISDSKNTPLSPYVKLSYSYLLTIWVNLLRVEALTEIDNINRSGDTFV